MSWRIYLGNWYVPVTYIRDNNTNPMKLDVLFESEEAKGLIISAHGMLPILEILEPCTVKSRQTTILRLLKVVNTVSTSCHLTRLYLTLQDYIERR
jgi:hypothetical protein